jgi:hypothetical protein
MSHLTETDSAEPEFAVDRFGPSALLASRVFPHLELVRLTALDSKALLSHLFQSPENYFLKGIPNCVNSARASSSVLAVVTKVISIPRILSILSELISGNTIDSLRPIV